MESVVSIERKIPSVEYYEVLENRSLRNERKEREEEIVREEVMCTCVTAREMNAGKSAGKAREKREKRGKMRRKSAGKSAGKARENARERKKK